MPQLCRHILTQGKFYFVLYHFFLHSSRGRSWLANLCVPMPSEVVTYKAVYKHSSNIQKDESLNCVIGLFCCWLGIFSKMLTLTVSTVRSLLVFPCDSQLFLLQLSSKKYNRIKCHVKTIYTVCRSLSLFASCSYPDIPIWAFVLSA